jgi:hypothetical protein
MKLSCIPVPRIKQGRITRPMTPDDITNESLRHAVIDRIRESGTATLSQAEEPRLLTALTCACAVSTVEDIGDVLLIKRQPIFVYMLDIADAPPYSILIDSLEWLRQWPVWDKPFLLGE